MKNEIKYEAVFITVSQGYSDIVMKAARECGCTGGTIINTRGAANNTAEKNYGVVITPDTELVVLLVDANIKNNIIEAVYKVAGIETKARGIIWSVAADNVMGFNKPKTNIEDKPVQEKENKKTKKQAKK